MTQILDQPCEFYLEEYYMYGFSVKHLSQPASFWLAREFYLPPRSRRTRAAPAGRFDSTWRALGAGLDTSRC